MTTNENINSLIQQSKNILSGMYNEHKAKFLFDNLNKMLDDLSLSFANNDDENSLLLADKISQNAIHLIQYMNPGFADKLCHLSAVVRESLKN
jgi:hypothetical protein